MRDQYDSGADPAVVLSDLAEFTHFVTRVKIVPAVADDPSLAEVERTRGRGFAAKLSMRVLSRPGRCCSRACRGGDAGRPIAAAEMVLVRIAYAADLPTPDEVIRSLRTAAAPARGAPGQRGGDAAPRNARGVRAGAVFDAARTAHVARGPAPARPGARTVGAPREPEPSRSAVVIGRFEELIALARISATSW